MTVLSDGPNTRTHQELIFSVSSSSAKSVVLLPPATAGQTRRPPPLRRPILTMYFTLGSSRKSLKYNTDKKCRY